MNLGQSFMRSILGAASILPFGLPFGGLNLPSPRTIKEQAARRTHKSGHTYVGSAKWVNRSRYWPHQGARECARRRRQMERNHD